MRIRQKLLGGFIMVSLLVGFVGAIGLFSSNQIISSFEGGEKHYGSIIVASTEVSSYAKRAEGHVMLYLTLHDPADKQKFFQRMDSLRNQTSIMDRTVENPEAMKIVGGIKSKTQELQSTGELLINAHDNEINATGHFIPENQAELIRKLNRLSSEIRESGVGLTGLEMQIKSDAEENAKEYASAIFSIILVLSLLSIFGALVIGYAFSRRIADPIIRLRKAMADVGKGALKTKIDIISKDEIGELAASFNSMIARLSESRSALEDYNKRLEKAIEEKEKSKKEQESKVEELEKFNRLSVGRELKMIELKKRIKELESRK